MDLKILFVLVNLVAVSVCTHLIIGEPARKIMIFHSVEQYRAIPFLKREKNVFFNDPYQRMISSIIAYDNLHSNSSAIITAGGIGSTFVNILLTSYRGKGLDYDIGIYA